MTGPGKSPIVAVVTQSPKPVGRKQVKTYSPIDKWAHEHKIPTYYDVESLINDKVEAEVAILESYGSILSKSAIEYFPKGIVNIHPSLLPKWRGASPVPATLIAGDNLTGGTVIKLDEQVDHGPIISQFKEDVLPDDTTDTLRRRLFERSAEVIIELLPVYLSEKVKPKPQDDTVATFTSRIKKSDAFIRPEYLKAGLEGVSLDEKWEIGFIKDYSQNITPENIERFIRAMQPWPQAWTLFEGKRLKLLKAHIENGKLILDEVQLEGKNPVTGKQFEEAYSSFRLS